MPSHKLSPRYKIRNKFSLRSKFSDRRPQRKNKPPQVHHDRSKDTVYTEDYIDYDYDDERDRPEKYKGSVGESNPYAKHKVHQDFEYLYKHRDTSTDYKSLETLDHTESLKSFITIPTTKNVYNKFDDEEEEEDHLKRPEPLDKSSVEMLRGEYRSYDENVFHFSTNKYDQRNIYDKYIVRETSSIKNYDFDDDHTEDTVSISDFPLHNDTEDIFDDSEKLIIVPSIIDIDEIKGQIKPKNYEEDFSNFNIDFEVNPYIETSTVNHIKASNNNEQKEISVDGDEEITDEVYKEASTANYKEVEISTTTPNKSFIDDEFDIVEDIEQLKNIEDKIVAETLEEFTETINNQSNTLYVSLKNDTEDTVPTTEKTEISTIANTNSTSYLRTSTENYEELFTVTDGNNLYSTFTETVPEESELFDTLNSDVIDQLYSLVKSDVELNLPILLNDRNYFVNFTKENFDKVIIEIHSDSSLKNEFKEYIRMLVQKPSHTHFKEIDEKETINISKYDIKHFHVKKKELFEQETRQQFIRVYQKIMLLSGFLQLEMTDAGSGDHQNDDIDTMSETYIDREMGDQPFSEISLALPSKKDINSDYYDNDEELKKKNKVTVDNDKNIVDRAIKTFDTPSGRVKILYQVNEKENTKKEKDKNNVNVDPVKPDSSSVQNTGKFLQESEKHKVSAVVTSDGKIGILVKSKPKNIDQTVDAGIFDERSYPNPKLVPTKVSEGNDFSIKTTVLRPVSGTEGISEGRSDRTVLKPIGTNVWTAVRKDDNIRKTTAKTMNIGEIPYDDEYYDEDDIKIESEGDQTVPTHTNTEPPADRTSLKEMEVPLGGNHNNKLNQNKTNDKNISDSNKNNLHNHNESDTKSKNVIRTFDEDFLKGLQKNMSEERRDRKPDFPGLKNHNSIDYRKSHDKSVYLNILDILGPDSKDVIQLLKDVKHINNDRSIKKQLDFNHKDVVNDNEKKTNSNEENIPILNRNPIEPPKIDMGMSDLDERILRKENDEVITDPYRERERNRVDFHLNKHLNSGREPEKDWNDDETRTKNLEDIWSDNEDELAEDSMVRIIPVHTGHSIFQKINLNKMKPDLTENVAGTVPAYYDTKHKTTYSDMEENLNTNNASHKSLETFVYRLVMCFCIIFSFSFYTAFSLIRIQSRYEYTNNIIYMNW